MAAAKAAARAATARVAAAVRAAAAAAVGDADGKLVGQGGGVQTRGRPYAGMVPQQGTRPLVGRCMVVVRLTGWEGQAQCSASVVHA